MHIDEATKYYGTLYKLAQALGMSPQAIYMWDKKKSIPLDKQFFIQQLTGGALLADPMPPRRVRKVTATVYYVDDQNEIIENK